MLVSKQAWCQCGLCTHTHAHFFLYFIDFFIYSKHVTHPEPSWPDVLPPFHNSPWNGFIWSILFSLPPTGGCLHICAFVTSAHRLFCESLMSIIQRSCLKSGWSMKYAFCWICFNALLLADFGFIYVFVRFSSVLYSIPVFSWPQLTRPFLLLFSLLSKF